ncbi:MAG: DUF3810 family protein [Planctomycetes bacterium]|nr:DUF3810 family protein [Planctomycetota bacterium]
MGNDRAGLRRWLVMGAVAVVVLGMTLPARWIEVGYCTSVFPWIQLALVSLTGRVPWPLSFTAIMLVPLLWPLLAWRRWRRARRQGVSRPRLWLFGALRFGRVLLYVGALFLLLWGFGYRRVPIEERWHLLEHRVGYDQVRDVGLRLLAIVRRDAPEPDAELDMPAAWRAIAAAERELVSTEEGWSPVAPRYVKHPPAGWLMAMGTYGVCYPWTLEANVDPALPPPIRLAVSGHELAHVLGYCGEADANLVSFVAGLRADHAEARYATALQMLRYAMVGPSAKDNAWLRMNLPERARRDLAALRAGERKHSVEVVAHAVSRLNNAYLEMQGVELGIEDYERGFRLFVHAFRRGMVAMPAPYPAAGESADGAGRRADAAVAPAVPDQAAAKK